MTKLFILIIGVAILVGGYFVIQKNFTQKKSPKTIEKLTVATTIDTPGLALIYIAQNKGFFVDMGLDVSFEKFPNGFNALADVIDGNSDIGLAHETPTVRKIYEGEELRIISTLHTSTKSIGIVGRKDKGILLAKDLVGKKIGVNKTSSYEFFLYSYLLSQGIKLSDVSVIDGPHTGWGDAMKTGKVDAVATGNPFLYDVKKAFPEEALTLFQSEVYTENSLLAGRDNIIQNKKEAIIRLLKALDKAENFYKTNNQEALNAVVAELPATSEENIRGTWDQFTPTLKLDNVLLTLLNREGQWFKDNGIYSTAVPDFRHFIFTDYLKEVKPDAVTLY